jgi:hypothetical protein
MRPTRSHLKTQGISRVSRQSLRRKAVEATRRLSGQTNGVLPNDGARIKKQAGDEQDRSKRKYSQKVSPEDLPK